MAHVPFLTEVITFLVATVVIVPLARNLRVSLILGYLAAGLLAGPSLLGLASNVDDVRTFAELGVVFLMFAFGLEQQSTPIQRAIERACNTLILDSRCS